MSELPGQSRQLRPIRFAGCATRGSARNLQLAERSILRPTEFKPLHVPAENLDRPPCLDESTWAPASLDRDHLRLSALCLPCSAISMAEIDLPRSAMLPRKARSNSRPGSFTHTSAPECSNISQRKRTSYDLRARLRIQLCPDRLMESAWKADQAQQYAAPETHKVLIFRISAILLGGYKLSSMH